MAESGASTVTRQQSASRAVASADEPELVLASTVCLALCAMSQILYFVVWSHLGSTVGGVLVGPLPVAALVGFVWSRIRWGAMREDVFVRSFKSALTWALGAFALQMMFVPFAHGTDEHCFVGALGWVFVALAFTGVRRAEPHMSSVCGFRTEAFLNVRLLGALSLVGLFEVVGLLVNMRANTKLDRGFFSFFIIVLVAGQTLGVWRVCARLRGSISESQPIMRGAALGSVLIALSDLVLLLHRTSISLSSQFTLGFVMPLARFAGLALLAFTADKETGFMLARLCSHHATAGAYVEDENEDDAPCAVAVAAPVKAPAPAPAPAALLSSAKASSSAEGAADAVPILAAAASEARSGSA